MTHFHVKSNTNRYLPDDDIHCVDTLFDAARAFVGDTKTLAVLMAEGCDRGGCNVCGWCQAYDEIMRVAANTEALRCLVRAETALFGTAHHVFPAPFGPELILWVETVDAPRANCLD